MASAVKRFTPYQKGFIYNHFLGQHDLWPSVPLSAFCHYPSLTQARMTTWVMALSLYMSGEEMGEGSRMGGEIVRTGGNRLNNLKRIAKRYWGRCLLGINN
jgi:hypothetical protein